MLIVRFPSVWHSHSTAMHSLAAQIARPKSYIMPDEVETWAMKVACKILDGLATDKDAGERVGKEVVDGLHGCNSVHVQSLVAKPITHIDRCVHISTNMHLHMHICGWGCEGCTTSSLQQSTHISLIIPV